MKLSSTLSFAFLFAITLGASAEPEEKPNLVRKASKSEPTKSSEVKSSEVKSSEAKSAKSAKSAKKEDKWKHIPGSNDFALYEAHTNAFVGLNPKLGGGSGFVIKSPNAINENEFGINPASGGPRVNLCTCDCTAGDDGVGCVGWGGVAFKYSTLLWKDPHTKNWDGQIQAFQDVGAGLNFMGKDTRLYPGGPAIYNVACTTQDCSDIFSGVFRQSNSAVSCKVGLEDRDANEDNGCFQRCGSVENDYSRWLDYCDAEVEDKSSGFKGYSR